MNRLIIGFVGALSACCEPGSGVIARESRAVSSFDQLVVDVPARVTLAPGLAGFIKITTDNNLLERIVTEVRDGRLVIDTGDDCCVDPTELAIALSAPDLRSIEVQGSADVIIGQPTGGPDLSLAIDGSGTILGRVPLAAETASLAIDGSGSIAIDLDVGALDSSIDGSGELRLSGVARDHAIDIDGSGDVFARALATESTSISIDGSGRCEVAVSKRLDVDIDGSGDVQYCGDPEVARRIDGSGSVVAGCE
jgi:hypothetical protein